MAKDRTPASTDTGKQPAAASPRAEIDAFLNKVKSLGPASPSGQRGRLIFALDATMSRQPMWDTACRLQGDMFNEPPRSAGWTFSSSIIAGWPNAAPRAGFRMRASSAG